MSVLRRWTLHTTHINSGSAFKMNDLKQHLHRTTEQQPSPFKSVSAVGWGLRASTRLCELQQESPLGITWQKKSSLQLLWWIITFKEKGNKTTTALNISSMVQIVLCLKNTPQHFLKFLLPTFALDPCWAAVLIPVWDDLPCHVGSGWVFTHSTHLHVKSKVRNESYFFSLSIPPFPFNTEEDILSCYIGVDLVISWI